MVYFLWVPVYTGVKGNEEVDCLAKMALKHSHSEINIAISKSEIKRIKSI